MMINEKEMRRIAELVVEVERQPAAQARPKKLAPRYITLREWAASQFSVMPHANTLLRWVHDGRIQPAPIKVGKSWWVKPNAEYYGG